MSARILVVDDDRAHLAMLQAMLQGWGYEVHPATDGEEAIALVHEQSFDAVLTDIRMAKVDGLEALRQIRSYNPFLPVLLMTAYSSLDIAVDALKAGAVDYLHKPLDFDELRAALQRTITHGALRPAPAESDAPELHSPIIGNAPPMLELKRMIQAVAPSEASVLILGESGTGKELVAKAIHQGSLRAAKPLVTVNCAALQENLLESELFGHEKGAFTGALRQRDGLFVHANGGTLFLDEIGEMAVALQAKLLRALQEGEIQRIGSDRIIRVDVRILAATNRDMQAEIHAGRFREDLYYRLNVIALHVPALRERAEDIPVLAQHFLTRFAERNKKAIRGFTPRAMNAMLRYAWPGNVRELENIVERAVILTPDTYIAERDLPAAITATPLSVSHESAEPASGAPGQMLEHAERQAITRTLEQANYNKSEAARLLGVTRVTLRNKMKKFGITENQGL
ncbi:sigma 54-interacting transcriptional regulator [Desulfovibrionales bacterium]